MGRVLYSHSVIHHLRRTWPSSWIARLGAADVWSQMMFVSFRCLQTSLKPQDSDPISSSATDSLHVGDVFLSFQIISNTISEEETVSEITSRIEVEEWCKQPHRRATASDICKTARRFAVTCQIHTFPMRANRFIKCLSGSCCNVLPLNLLNFLN